jgi:hypothetical protein
MEDTAIPGIMEAIAIRLLSMDRAAARSLEVIYEELEPNRAHD